MKFVKWLLISIGLLLGLFVVVTFFLPKDYHIERSVVIEAPALVVYSQVVDLKVCQNWDPWNELDSDMVITYGEKTVGVGASYAWTSEVTGNGSMEIIEATAPTSVRYKLLFEGYEDNPGYSAVLLNAESPVGPTTVTWTFDGDVGDKFFARWFAVTMDAFIGPSYEKGLGMLRDLCEEIVDTMPSGTPHP
jgi:hypothetical protein